MKHRFASLLVATLLGVAGLGCDANSATQVDDSAHANLTGAGAAEADSNNDASAHQILVMLHLPPPHLRPNANYRGTYDDQPGHGARRRIAEKLALEHGLKLLSDWPMPALGVDCYVMSVPVDVNVVDVAQSLSKDPRTEWVQPMNMFHGLESPTSLYSLQPSAKVWHLDELHRASTGRGISIAIVDSGVDSAHPDLAGRVAIDENLVDARVHVAESHGTAVAGIIGARADDGAGIVGIAPQARLMALRACWEASPEKTLCSSFTLAKALQFAIEAKADVINMSLTGPQDKLLGRLLDVALERNTTVVGAVDPDTADGGFPAMHPGVLAVSDESAHPTAERILFAPGNDIPTTAPGGRWSFVSGASFAAAHVAGMVALVKELAPATTMRDPVSWAVFPTGSSDGPVGEVDACGTLRRSAPAFTCSHVAGLTQRSSW